MKILRTASLGYNFTGSYENESVAIMYKSFMTPNLEYGDIIFDQAHNKSFHENLESFRYNASLAITGAIRRTSKEKLFPRTRF